MSVSLDEGDTLLDALTEAGASYSEAHRASTAVGDVMDPRRLQVGQRISLRLEPYRNGKEGFHVDRLSLVYTTDRKLTVEHQPDENFRARQTQIEHETRLVSSNGTITASLYKSARDDDVPTSILLQAYRVLGHAVDFQRDIRKGDAFALAYELLDDGRNGGIHAGNLVYASLTLGKENLSIYRYETEDGYEGFFDSEGRSIETSLLKTPVDGGRLSSLFGKRDHPILDYSRMHKGLDFAAPRGAPILAAGDGVVVRRSRYGSFGNYIRLRHDSTYATAYAHLSRYAKGLAPGDRVQQGEVIGYVGATGLATGPNLHYEVLSEGRPVNPVRLELPPRRTLAARELERFQRWSAELLTTLKAGKSPANEQDEAASPGTFDEG